MVDRYIIIDSKTTHDMMVQNLQSNLLMPVKFADAEQRPCVVWHKYFFRIVGQIRLGVRRLGINWHNAWHDAKEHQGTPFMRTEIC